MSSHADTIRATLEARLWVGQYFKNDPGVPAALNALDEWEAENQQLEAERDLAETYVPVDAWTEYAASREALAGDTE